MENGNILRKIYEETKNVFKSENPNYKKTLAYRLLNCIKCEDVDSFLNIVLRSIISKDNTKNLVNLLFKSLSNKYLNKKDVMYSFVIGLIG